MRFLSRILLFFLMWSGFSAFAQQPTYVIVHGAWGGAWQFKNTAKILSEKGNVVYRPTLTGLGERFHLMNNEVDLGTHINDVVNTILFENLTNVVLVGHSYGGVVISGVADSIPERIKRLVYLDAIVLDNNQSVIESLQLGSSGGSFPFSVENNVIVPQWVKDTKKTPRDVPHPARTMTQKLVLDNSKRLEIPTTYIFTSEVSKGGEEKDDFYKFYQKAKTYNWNIVKMEASHNPQIDKLDELVDILEKQK